MSAPAARLAALLGTLACVEAAASAQAVEIGQPLPAFEATALSGEPFSLEAAIRSHKAVVVVFLSTVCPYAKYFGAHLRGLDERYGPRGVLFVGVLCCSLIVSSCFFKVSSMAWILDSRSLPRACPDTARKLRRLSMIIALFIQPPPPS